VVFLTVLIVIVFGVYGSGWAESARVPEPNHVRVLLIVAVLALALIANSIGRVLFGTRDSSGAREILSGVLVIGVLSYVGNFYAGRYLGGNAIGTPDMSGFHYLMVEGWGMMFLPLCVVFGVLTMLREGFEMPSSKAK
jgi:hypothetical protein